MIQDQAEVGHADYLEGSIEIGDAADAGIEHSMDAFGIPYFNYGVGNWSGKTNTCRAPPASRANWPCAPVFSVRARTIRRLKGYCRRCCESEMPWLLSSLGEIGMSQGLSLSTCFQKAPGNPFELCDRSLLVRDLPEMFSLGIRSF
jgi:hypothetical protein